MIEIQQLLKIPELKRTSERAELIKFFVENLRNKKDRPYAASYIAYRLSHLSVKDLYTFKSMCEDRLRRNGQEAFQKFFWWSIKSK